MLTPVYGFDLLKMPPEGVPNNAMESPAHPLTFDEVTIGEAFTIIVDVDDEEHPLESVKV